MNPEDLTGAVLTVDLGALATNWRQLAGRVHPARCGAAVKGDAYGLGLARVAPALARAGCRVFFVATVDEGLALRALVPEAEIHVLNGPPRGAAALLAENRLIPTLNSLGDVEYWRTACAQIECPLPAALHVDTGMARLGLPDDELARAKAEPELLAGFDLVCIMSHLACADTPAHPMNAAQLAAFHAILDGLPRAPASLANSSGVFLGGDFHFDLARPGYALYGGNPNPSDTNPMAQVVHLQGKILQVRVVDTPQTVGYGATHRVAGRRRIAAVAVGYADGFLRSLGNSGSAYIGDVRAPVVGRVSMDLITIDATDASPEHVRPGAYADLIGPHYPIDAMARDAKTIGYEVLTRLGGRFRRVYRGEGGASE